MGAVHVCREPFITGMIIYGSYPVCPERCVSQIENVAGYDFPESHAAALARLVDAPAG